MGNTSLSNFIPLNVIGYETLERSRTPSGSFHGLIAVSELQSPLNHRPVLVQGVGLNPLGLFF